MTTAYINDVDGLGVFAQQLYGFGRPEFYKNRVNAGLHVIDPEVLDMLSGYGTSKETDDISVLGLGYSIPGR